MDLFAFLCLILNIFLLGVPMMDPMTPEKSPHRVLSKNDRVYIYLILQMTKSAVLYMPIAVVERQIDRIKAIRSPR